MLIPGGLARMSIELLPANRYDNALQATLVTDADPVLALFRNRTIPGVTDLADVSPDTVAELAVSMLKDELRFEALMAGPAAGVGADADPAAGPPAPLPASRPTAGGPPAPEPGPPLRPSLRRFAGRRLDERASARAEQELRREAQSQQLPAVMTDARGMRFELESADEVLTFLRHGGHFEADEVAICHRWLEPGMTAVDVGANLGAFTAAFASAVGREGTVHSLEPFDAARRRLERTLALNELPQVQVHPLAVADGAGTAALYSYGPGNESWATLGPRRIEAGGTTVDAEVAGQVPTVSLDDWAEQNSVASIDLLKVDVEGAEGRVLAGAERLLSDGRIALALVETSDDTLESFGVRAYELIRTLEGHGLRTYVARDGRLVPFRVAGRTQGLANVFAASPRALQRLRELELAD
jgi:FkbM family methyltransferase